MRMLQSIFAVISLCALLGGCAAPIISHDRSRELALGTGGTMEGFTYYLAKSTPKVVFRVRLEKCDTPTVTVLAPDTTATAKADRAAQFRVTPTDAFNLFRSIESKLTLTPDGRLGSASAISEDKTVAVLTQFIKDAAAVNRTLSLFTRSPAPAVAVAQLLVPKCTDEAKWLVEQRDAALKALQKATFNESNFLADPKNFVTGVAEAQKTYAEALLRLKAKVDELNAKLTKSTAVALDVTAGQDAMSKEDFIDVTYGWFEPTIGGGCVITKKDGKDEIVAGSNCLRFSAAVARAPKPSSSTSADFSPPVASSGVWYRQSALHAVEAQVSRNARASGAAHTIRVEMDTERPLAMALPSANVLANEPIVIDQTNVRIPQWGTLAKLPMDVGLMTNNEVRVEFDEWSVPKTVEWKVAPSTIPGLLGLVPQASAAFAKPAVDPTAALRGDLLTQLLQSCITALATGSTLPSYCSSILK